MELSIVVAVYNEQEVLAELERRLSAAMAALGQSYEIILVDDGSRDDSLNILLDLQQRDPEHIRVFSFTRNFGHHIALTAGLDHAKGDVIVMMDADLQDQPEEIPKLLAKLDEGYDVVWGERETRQFKWYKNLSSKLFLWLMNSVARSEVHLDSSIFRAMRRTVADDLRELREKARYLPGLVRWLGYKQTSVPVVHGARFAGQTKYSFWRLIKLALSTATSFSAAPLQFATVAGMGTAALATLAVVYIVIRKVLGGYAVPGYASIMIAIFFFGALQLIVIGLMGEYISRIYREAQGRPLYLLRDLLPKEEGERMTDEGRGVTSQRLSTLSSAEREELFQAIASDVHLPLASVFKDGERDALVDYHFSAWKNANPLVFLERDGNRIAASALLTELEWDTRMLGLPAGRILYANAVGGAVEPGRINALHSVLHNVIDFSREKKLRLLDARVSSEDLFVTRAFEAAGFHLVDLLVTLGAPREKFDRVLGVGGRYTRSGASMEFGNGLRVRPMRPEDEAVLAKISEASFGDHTMIQDRFFLEPMIPPERSQDLFREWFSNIARKHAESDALILAAELDGAVCGYIALEPMAVFGNELWWKDSLNAVATDARGRGVYRALVLAAFEYAREHDAAGLLTKTQASTQRVINSWLHLGGDIIESAATLHWTSL
jgi:polyisoprenyl-phosphate glycosyltransferase